MSLHWGYSMYCLYQLYSSSAEVVSLAVEGRRFMQQDGDVYVQSIPRSCSLSAINDAALLFARRRMSASPLMDISQAANLRSSLSSRLFDCCTYAKTWRTEIICNALWCTSNITVHSPENAGFDVHSIGPGKYDTHEDSCHVMRYPDDA